jgi:hypothetical protein
MKLLRVGMIFAAGVGAIALTAATMSGCGGDDTAVPDASPDVKSDTTLPDTGPDALPDTGPDATDSGDGAAPVGPFLIQQLKLTCQRYGQCCFGADAAAFDQGACEKAFADFGWEGNIREPAIVLANLPDAGPDGAAPPLNIALDPVNAQKCLAAVSTFDCPTIKAVDDVNIFTVCFSAVKGLATVGQKCGYSVECTSGNYCKPGDGGSTCQPLEAIGAQCDQAPDNNACQYRGYLGTPARCDLVAADGGTGSNKCASKFPNGTACTYNWDCASGVCNAATFTCDTSTLTTTPDLCALFKK